MWGGGGEIRPDVGSKASDKVIIKTTPEQDRIYQNYLDNLDVSHHAHDKRMDLFSPSILSYENKNSLFYIKIKQE
jgi:hypothetical protein